MDFNIDTLGAPVQLDDASAELRPVFDPRLRTFSVQLWKGGEPSGIHGLTEVFRYADEPLMAIDAFLAERGVRALTGEEAGWLYAGLVHAKGADARRTYRVGILRTEFIEFTVEADSPEDAEARYLADGIEVGSETDSTSVESVTLDQFALAR